MMVVDVELDWTNTVTSTPIITPTTGLFKSSELPKKATMFLPPRSLNESDRKDKEQMKK